MRWRLPFLLALMLPELALAPFQGEAPCGLRHPLGTDLLGRDALARLLFASARTLGFASAVAMLTLACALLLALGSDRMRGARSALRLFPPMLLLLPIAAAWDGLGWISVALLLSGMMSLQFEPALRERLDPVRHSPAWIAPILLGASPWHRLRTWSPWAMAQASPLYATAWISAVWGETTLRLLGLGPPPTRDSFGLILHEELPRLATDPTALGWAALAMAMLLAACSMNRPRA